jgi:hypothetical protein
MRYVDVYTLGGPTARRPVIEALYKGFVGRHRYAAVVEIAIRLNRMAWINAEIAKHLDRAEGHLHTAF